jgi:uncharacterized protein
MTLETPSPAFIILFAAENPEQKEPPAGDCACANPYLTTREGHVQERSSHTLYKVINAHYISLSPYTLHYGPHHTPVLLNQPARELLTHFQTPANLDTVNLRFPEIPSKVIEKAVSDLIASRLLIPVNSTSQFLDTPTTLSAWLHVTDRCNLRCSYCYLPHHKQDMTPEVGRASIDAVIRSATANEMQQVKLKYAGGEALLLWPLVEDLHQYAARQTEEKSLALDAVVLSNGTLLTNEIARRMHALKLRLMISLDGYGAVHDAHRPYAGGRGTFKDVVQGIELALENGLTPDISITISGKNAPGLADLLEWVLEKNLPFSLNFYRENELSATHRELQLEEQNIIEGILAAYQVIEQNLPARSLLASLVDRANLSAPHLRTCSVGQNYLVFDYRGNVSKCQMQLFKPVTHASAEDPLKFIREDSLGIQNISVEEKEGCRECEWKYWCTGGCSLATYRATGRYDVKSPNCNIYKALYPAALRLEGLRLLKYRLAG